MDGNGWVWSGIVFVVDASGFLVWSWLERRRGRGSGDGNGVGARRLGDVFDEYEREQRGRGERGR